MYRLLASTLLLAFTTALIGDELRGKVVFIADGDTITVLDDNKKQNKVRLNGIDAPEKKQAFGNKSKARLGELVAGKEVVVGWKEKDKYGRILGQVHQGSLDVNLQMVKEGLAWHYKKYSKSAELSRAEEEAKAGKKGLWADPNPVPPWEFRGEKKRKSSETAELAHRFSPLKNSPNNHLSMFVRWFIHLSLSFLSAARGHPPDGQE